MLQLFNISRRVARYLTDYPHADLYTTTGLLLYNINSFSQQEKRGFLNCNPVKKESTSTSIWHLSKDQFIL